MSNIKNKDFTFRGHIAFKTTYTCYLRSNQSSSVFSVFHKDANMLPLMTFRCWVNFLALFLTIIQQMCSKFHVKLLSPTLMPADGASRAAPRPFIAAGADGYGLMGCRLFGLKPQLWAYCHRIGQGTTSALLWSRKWIKKNSAELSRADAQVHESIMSLHECKRSHCESLHSHWVECHQMDRQSLAHNSQEKIKCNRCNRYITVEVLSSFSSTRLSVQL